MGTQPIFGITMVIFPSMNVVAECLPPGSPVPLPLSNARGTSQNPDDTPDDNLSQTWLIRSSSLRSGLLRHRNGIPPPPGPGIFFLLNSEAFNSEGGTPWGACANQQKGG